jgi:isopenicillin N synthase-like dioxygenase
VLLDVPVIDIGPFRKGDPKARQAVAAEVGRAIKDIGFLVITGHGVDPALVKEVQRVSNAFFDLPEDEKREVIRPAPDVTRGYIPLEAESVGRSQGVDAPGYLNESLMVGPVDVTDDPYFAVPEAGRHFHPNLWPRRPEGLWPAHEDYFRVMGKLAEDLMGYSRSRSTCPSRSSRTRSTGISAG